MIDIFEVRDDQLTVSNDVLSVGSFRAIWDHDKTKKKASAMDHFLYIYHMHHPKSPYSGYPDAERESAIRERELSGTLRTSKRLQAAIEDFKKLRDDADPLFRLFQSAKGVLFKMTSFYDDIDPKDENFDIKQVTDAMIKLDALVKAYDSLETQVKEKIYTQTKTRGNREINPFEE